MIPKKPRPNKPYNNRPKNGKVFASGETGQNFDHNRHDSSKARPSNGQRNYQQLFDKYNNLAREALMSGDRVAAEFHYQHADHYLRLLNERQAYRSSYGYSSEVKDYDRPTREEEKEYFSDLERPEKQPESFSSNNFSDSSDFSIHADEREPANQALQQELAKETPDNPFSPSLTSSRPPLNKGRSSRRPSIKLA